MSGHSKWATIKRKKGKTDAARGRVFTRLVKELTIAARMGGGDPGGNPRLRLAIDGAKANNMPADNIKRAIQKGTGELEGVSYEEIMYEGYGAGGVAILVDSATDNKNRTVAEIRHIFSRNNGNMGESGSVGWMFERKGVIMISRETCKKSEDEMFALILDLGADDLKTFDDSFEVVTTVEQFETVRKGIEAAGVKIEEAGLRMIAKNSMAVDDATGEKVIALVEALEDNDDVQNVYTNLAEEE